MVGAGEGTDGGIGMGGKLALFVSRVGLPRRCGWIFDCIDGMGWVGGEVDEEKLSRFDEDEEGR